MTNLAVRDLKIISSIPGRARIKVDGLFKNEKLGYEIVNYLKKSEEVTSISFNKYTGNILIYFKYQNLNLDDLLNKLKSFSLRDSSNVIPRSPKNDSIGKIVLKAMNPINLLRKKYWGKAFENEYSLAKRLIKIGIPLGALVFSFNRHIRDIISILILTYPGMLFAISTVSYYYCAKKAFFNKIYLRNSKYVALFAKTNSIVIEDDVVTEKNNMIKDFEESNSGKNRVERLDVLGRIKNLTNPEIGSFIKGIREYGIKDISIFSDEKRDIVEYISYSLGIDEVNLLDDKTFVLNDYENQENTIIIVYEGLLDETTNEDSNLTICLYKVLKKDFYKGNVNVIDKNIKKLPWLFKLSKDNRELITRCHTSIISVNMLVFLVTIILRMNAVFTLSIYMLNLLIHILIVKNNILKEENRDKYFFRYAYSLT